jgi:hypothetical protein
MEKKKIKTKVKATDRSQITDKNIGEILKEKIEYAIDLTKKTEPYINWLSKYALVWGGKIFNDLDFDNPLRVGFVSSYDYKNRRYKQSHLPGRMPTESEQIKMERLYGVALPWPPRGLSDIIQTSFRDIEDKLIENDDSIIIAPCRGYIDRNGKLIDPAWNRTEEWNSNMVSGYLIYRKDSEGFKVIQNYLLTVAEPWFQRQVERVKYTAPILREARISAANSASIKGDRRLQRISSLTALQTNEHIEDWSKLLSLEASVEEAENEE